MTKLCPIMTSGHGPSASPLRRRAGQALTLGLAAGLIIAPVSAPQAQVLRLSSPLDHPRFGFGLQEFGHAVDLDDRVLVVSEPSAVVAVPVAGVLVNTSAGALHVFDAESGALQRTIFDPAPIVGGEHRFGEAIAVVGGSILVATTSGLSVIDLASGQLERMIDGPAGYSTASDLAVSGSHVAVVWWSFFGRTAGVVDVLDIGTWSRLLRIGGSGSSVGLDEQTIAVGVPARSERGVPISGLVNLFDVRSGAALRTLSSPEPQSGDGFGASVAVAGDRVLVGAPDAGRFAPLNTSGRAYLFDTTTGASLGALEQPPRVPGRRCVVGSTCPLITSFGSCVRMGGGQAVVGGRAGVAVYDSATGALKAMLVPEASATAGFGICAVDLAGDRLVAGYPGWGASEEAERLGLAELYAPCCRGLGDQSTTRKRAMVSVEFPRQGAGEKLKLVLRGAVVSGTAEPSFVTRTARGILRPTNDYRTRVPVQLNPVGRRLLRAGPIDVHLSAAVYARSRPRTQSLVAILAGRIRFLP